MALEQKSLATPDLDTFLERRSKCKAGMSNSKVCEGRISGFHAKKLSEGRNLKIFQTFFHFNQFYLTISF